MKFPLSLIAVWMLLSCLAAAADKPNIIFILSDDLAQGDLGCYGQKLIAGANLPVGFRPDGYSLVSYLKGGAAPKRDYFYWELHEGKPQQAVRSGDWKGVKPGPAIPLELCDLKSDVTERNNLAAEKPELVAKAETLMRQARVDDPNWPLTFGPAKTKQNKNAP